MHSKLNARIVGKMRSAGDSVAASGIPGTTTNRLPGRGSFELYCSDQTGLRIQAPFVASSDKPGYEKALQPFFADIRQRWADDRPGWAPPMAIERVGRVEAVKLNAVAQETPEEPQEDTGPAIDPALLAELREEYQHDPEAFSVRTVRRCWALVYQKEISHSRAKPIFEIFTQELMATSGD